MQQADALCDRVAIIDQGKILTCDSPSAIKRKSRQATYFQITTEALNGCEQTLRQLPGVLSCQVSEVDAGTELRLTMTDDGVIAPVVGSLTAQGKRILALQKVEPTLEDVFVETVGRGFADETETAA